MISDRLQRWIKLTAAFLSLAALTFAAVSQLHLFEGGLGGLEREGSGSDFRITDAHRALGGISHDASWLNTTRALKAEDLAGRILLVDFWTYACINCIHSIPDLKYLESKYGDRLTVLGVHSGKFSNEKSSENIRAAVVKHDIRHPVVNDAEFRIWHEFGVQAWPTFVLISPEGSIARVYSGEGHREELDRAILELTQNHLGRINTRGLPLEAESDKQPDSILRFPTKLAYASEVPVVRSGEAAEPGRRHSGVVFVSDSGHHRIVGFDLSGRIVHIIGAKGEPGHVDGAVSGARFREPHGLAYRNGVLFVADTGNHSVRAVDLNRGSVTTLAGTGRKGYVRDAKGLPASKTPMASPWDLAFFPDRHHLAVALAGNHQIWTYDFRTQSVSVLAGSGAESIRDGRLPENALAQPSALASFDGKLFFLDSETSALRVIHGAAKRRGEVETLIGKGLFEFGFRDGTAGEALLQHPLGLAADQTGVYIADAYNHSIRRFDFTSNRLETVIGNGQAGLLNEPADIVLTPKGLVVSDTNHHQLEWLRTAEGDLPARLEPIALTGDPREAPARPARPAADQTRRPSKFLPNARPLNTGKLKAGTEIPVRFRLDEGWKINDAAPTWMAIFQEDGTLVREFSREEIQTGEVSLPALGDEPYLLQGSFYFCRKDRPDVCVVQSVNETVKVSRSGAADGISIRISR